MARLPRIGPAGISQHVIQRGNNRQICFASEQDLAFYANCLKDYSQKFSVVVHSWVFMTNHVHLLITPLKEGAVSEMMQGIGRHYVRYFDREYARSGTLWEGRFKSSLVQTSSYLLACQKYIELNPVRAGMVSDPADYVWSSYQCSALGRISSLFQPHAEYIALGVNNEERQFNYRKLFSNETDGVLISNIRDSLNKGMALGDERFRIEIEATYGRRVRPAKIGRPRKPRESLI